MSATSPKSTAKQEKDLSAIQLFNDVKDAYQKQIKMLTALKREVTRSDLIDQTGKSTLRIQIESLLIDLNEEVFLISEELANAFAQSIRPSSDNLYYKAQECEQKKVRMLTKIRKSITNNPLVRIIRGQSLEASDATLTPGANSKISTGSFSPPQRDTSNNQASRLVSNLLTSKQTSHGQLGISRDYQTPIHIRDMKSEGQTSNRRTSTAKSARRTDNRAVHQNSIETFGHNNDSPPTHQVPLKKYAQEGLGQNYVRSHRSNGESNSAHEGGTKIRRKKSAGSHSRQTSKNFKPQVLPMVIPRSKSPSLPLRNRIQATTSSQQQVPRQMKMRRVGSEKSLRLMDGISDNRNTNLSLSKQTLSTKKALNRLYTMDVRHQRKKSRNSKSQNSRNQRQQQHQQVMAIAQNLIPKYSGCGPGGVNASLIPKSSKDPFNSLNSTSQTDAQLEKIGMQNGDLLNLQLNDKSLKLTRRQATRQNFPGNFKSLEDDVKVVNHEMLGGQLGGLHRHLSDDGQFIVQQQAEHKLVGRTLQNTIDQQSVNSSTFHQSMKQRVSKTPIVATADAVQQQTNLFFQSSDAILQFSKDFDLMRKKFGEILHKMDVYDRTFKSMTNQIEKLTTENLKLNSDIKVIRNEHTEMVHSVYQLQKRNEALMAENLTLKEVIQKSARRGREVSLSPKAPSGGAANDIQPQRRRSQKSSGQYVETTHPSQQKMDKAAHLHQQSIVPTNSFSGAHTGTLDMYSAGLTTVQQQPWNQESHMQKILQSPFSNAINQRSSRESISRQEGGDKEEPDLGQMHDVGTPSHSKSYDHSQRAPLPPQMRPSSRQHHDHPRGDIPQGSDRPYNLDPGSMTQEVVFTHGGGEHGHSNSRSTGMFPSISKQQSYVVTRHQTERAHFDGPQIIQTSDGSQILHQESHSRQSQNETYQRASSKHSGGILPFAKQSSDSVVQGSHTVSMHPSEQLREHMFRITGAGASSGQINEQSDEQLSDWVLARLQNMNHK